MRRGTLRRAVVPLVLVAGGVVVAVLVLGGSGDAGPLPDTLAVEQLDCPISGPEADEGTGAVVVSEQVFDHDEVPDDGRPVPLAQRRETPAEALVDYVEIVARDQRGLDPDDFTPAGQEGHLADFELVKDGDAVRRVRMERIGPGEHWAPVGAIACGD